MDAHERRALPEGWEWKRLGDVITLEYGKGLREDLRDQNGNIPVYGSNGIVGFHSAPLIEKPCIIVGRKGSAGQVHRSKVPCWPIDTTYFITPPENIDLYFLFYLLSTLKLVTLDKSTAIPGLNRNDAYALKIPLPPLPTQRRIVSILEKAEETKRLRAQADELTDRLLQSVFLEMFYKNNPDYNNWELVSIQNLASPEKGSMRTGPFGSNLKHSEFINSGIAVLGIDNAVNNRFQWDQRRYISVEKYHELKNYTVYPNDVLITIMATIGKSCVVPNDIPLSISTKHLAVITCDKTKCDPQFLSNSIILHPEIKRQMSQALIGAIMDGLNLKIIKSLEIPLPPLPSPSSKNSPASSRKSNSCANPRTNQSSR